VAGYHVYRSITSNGPFVRLTSSLSGATNFTDTTSSTNASTYMVRAVKLQTNPSGSYYNPSQGIFTTIPATGSAIRIAIRRSANAVLLTWNSQVGTSYRVMGKDNLGQGTWIDLSGSIVATATTNSWTMATNIGSRGQQFLRVVSP